MTELKLVDLKAVKGAHYNNCPPPAYNPNCAPRNSGHHGS